MTTIIERDRSDSSAATVIVGILAILAIMAIGYAVFRYLPPAGARTDEPTDSLNINVNGQLPSGDASSPNNY